MQRFFFCCEFYFSHRAKIFKMEPETRLRRLKPDRQLAYRAPRLYTVHDCSSHCCSFDENSSVLCEYGQLMRPLISGWRRINKRVVSYITPCGLSMRSLHAIKRYLNVTKCQHLDVDNFCFDRRVDCLREYVTDERYILNEVCQLHTHCIYLSNRLTIFYFQDISNGIEAKAIRVANETNESMIDAFTYVTQNHVHRDVPYQSVDYCDSMVCCECKDDCNDRNRCPCWQLTLGASFPHDFPLNKIYEYKRLYTTVVSGIYECNINCKCSRKCSNRVTQLPIAHNFELFMTANCGWGIRCRNDLPRGAFICCYLGDLRTEELSIEIARNHGDAYMATLDLIEYAGQFKDGYESEAINSGSDSDTPPPKKRQRVTGSSRKICRDSVEIDAVNRGADSQSIKYLPTTRTRQLFGPNETSSYIIDARRFGNVGRFLNVRPNCGAAIFSIRF